MSYLFHLEHPRIEYLPRCYLPWNRSKHTLPVGQRLAILYVAPHVLTVHLDHNLFPGDTPMQTYHYPLPKALVGHTQIVACLP